MVRLTQRAETSAIRDHENFGITLLSGPIASEVLHINIPGVLEGIMALFTPQKEKPGPAS